MSGVARGLLLRGEGTRFGHGFAPPTPATWRLAGLAHVGTMRRRWATADRSVHQQGNFAPMANEPRDERAENLGLLVEGDVDGFGGAVAKLGP